MKNLILNKAIYNTNLFWYLFVFSILNIPFCERLYSQEIEYSRPFIHSTQNGDMLQSTPSQDNGVFYTSFKWETLNDLLEGSENNWYVKVDLVDPIFQSPRFRLTLYNSTGKEMGARKGDYPCPEECIPPIDTSFIPRDNTFDVGDLRKSMNRPGCTLVNVHASSRSITGGGLLPSHCIYAVSGTINNPTNVVLYTQSGEPIFTSILRKE